VQLAVPRIHLMRLLSLSVAAHSVAVASMDDRRHLTLLEQL
jgi:hypothetical protein